jgi:hypothetical protein
MSDPTDDDRPRSAPPAVPPFQGPRNTVSPRPAATSPAPRPFIPGAQAAAAAWPVTPPAPSPTEPETAERESFASSRPEPDVPPVAAELPPEENAAAAAAPAPADDPDLQSGAIAEDAAYALAPKDTESEREGRITESTVEPVRNVVHESVGTGASDQRLPALRFTGSSAFAAIPGASDGADVDASVDDAFSALDPSTPRVQTQAVPIQPVAEAVPAAESSTEPAASVDLPWLDTGSEPARAPGLEAQTSVAAAHDAPERVARALEVIAMRVRRGELSLPPSVDGVGEEAALAAVLAALLGARG